MGVMEKHWARLKDDVQFNTYGITEDFLNSIQVYMEQKDITLTELSKRTGVSMSYYSRLFSMDYNDITFKTIAKIAIALDLSFEIKLKEIK